MIFRLIVFTIGLALGAAAQAVAQLATPAPAPQPEASASAAPTETPTPAPTATSSPSASAAPSPTATPENPYKYVVEPTPDPSASAGAPQIIRIEIIDKTVHIGGQFACRITTSSNVANLVLSIEGHDIAIPKSQDGIFAGIQAIPSFIPPWFLKTYQVTFNALTADGKKASMTIPITLAY